MNPTPNPTLSRRSLIRNGSIAISFGGLVAACGGDDRLPPDAPGRLGVAPDVEPLADEEIDDVHLLRTAQSLEHTAIDVHAAAQAAGALSAGEVSLSQRFVDDHQRHAADIEALITGLGGDEFTCANPFLVSRAVEPVLAAIDGSDDLHRDLLNIAYAFEALAGASYQAMVSSLTDPALRVTMMTIGGEEHRHAAALGHLANPSTHFSPVLSGGQAESDANGIPLRYAIPSIFGTVDGIALVVGAVNDEGSRYSTQLQTPAANSFIYSDMSC